ncbi:MAG: hypothetical protein ACTSPI_16885 [Candidatus Heimdallarchaeaceae archaeon]
MKPKIEQLIQWKDETGMMKNTSELLQEIRDGNIQNLCLGYTRKDGSMRGYWFGSQKSMAEFFLLVSQMKHDYLSSRIEESDIKSYGEQ